MKLEVGLEKGAEQDTAEYDDDGEGDELREARNQVVDVVESLDCDPPVRVHCGVIDRQQDCMYFPLSSTSLEHQASLKKAVELRLSERYTLIPYTVREPSPGFPLPLATESLAICRTALPLETEASTEPRPGKAEKSGSSCWRPLFTVSVVIVCMSYAASLIFDGNLSLIEDWVKLKIQ